VLLVSPPGPPAVPVLTQATGHATGQAIASGGQWAGLGPSRWAGETEAIDLETLSFRRRGRGPVPPPPVRSESGGDEVRVWRRGY
jgi:hypothetical protein